MKTKRNTALLGIALTVAVSSVSTASAVPRSTLQNAVGACNGALPGYEGALRKRPLAIANEGTVTAIVSCTLPTEQTFSSGNTSVAIGLINKSTALVAISCTFVDGLAPEMGGGAPVYYVKNIAIAPGEGGSLQWDAEDHALESFSPYASISCGLAPGTEIAAMAQLSDDGT